jgi:RNA polymerase sigma-70 factor, ECF subfamily
MSNSKPVSKHVSKNASDFDWRKSCASATGIDVFEDIYRSYAELVYGVCLRTLRDPIEAEDATQDVFVRVLLKLHTFRGEAAFSSWLYRLAMNVVLMRFRKNRKSISLDEVPDLEVNNRAGTLMMDAYPSNEADRIDLQTAITHLPSGFKTVFILHDIQGYRHRQIAQFFGYSEGNSKAQLHRARMRLRKLLQRESTSRN